MMPEKIRKNEEQHGILSDLIYCNEEARKATDPSKRDGYHRSCAHWIEHLMRGGYGVVSRHFMYLQNLGEGKPRDDICLLTKEYANLLNNEETDNDIYTIFLAEEMEEDIRTKFERKKREGKNVKVPRDD